jgi:hypothetical protein
MFIVPKPAPRLAFVMFGSINISPPTEWSSGRVKIFATPSTFLLMPTTTVTEKPLKRFSNVVGRLYHRAEAPGVNEKSESITSTSRGQLR